MLVRAMIGHGHSRHVTTTCLEKLVSVIIATSHDDADFVVDVVVDVVL
jgi:hypothetical protein